MSTPKALSRLAPKQFRLPVGQKEIWLPNFTITLLRTPHLPPNTASFLVPLNLNKLDLKDYLWHAYSLPVLSVRSMITQSPVRQDKPGAINPKRFLWYRPRAQKRMIVELAEGERSGPFVWPDEIKDLKDWDQEAFEAGEKERRDQQDTMQQRRRYFGLREPRDKERVREQARRLLEGREEWRPSWMEGGSGRVIDVVEEEREERRREGMRREAERRIEGVREEKGGKDGRGDSGGDGGGVVPVPVPLPV